MKPADTADGRERGKSPAPFFIVGSPRSGTTMLFLMLDSHPEVAVPPESHFIPSVWRRRGRYGSEGKIEDPGLFVSDLARDPQFRHWNLPPDLVAGQLGSGPAPTISGGIDAVFRAYARTQGKAQWGDKTPEYVRHIPLLDNLFPEARFIHLIRDGRDVALSIIALKRLHHRAATAAYFWARDIRCGRSAGMSLGPSRYFELHYEDLVGAPRDVMQQICAFLDLSPHEAMLADHDRSLAKIPVHMRWMHSREKLPPTRGLRDWRRDMEHREVAEWEAIAGSELVNSGYERATRSTGPLVWLVAWMRVARFAVRFLPDRVGFRGRIRRRIRERRRDLAESNRTD